MHLTEIFTESSSWKKIGENLLLDYPLENKQATKILKHRHPFLAPRASILALLLGKKWLKKV